MCNNIVDDRGTLKFPDKKCPDTENALPENDRKLHPRKMHTWKYPDTENGRTHTPENERKLHPRKMAEKAHLEISRHGKCTT